LINDANQNKARDIAIMLAFAEKEYLEPLDMDRPISFYSKDRGVDRDDLAERIYPDPE